MNFLQRIILALPLALGLLAGCGGGGSTAPVVGGVTPQTLSGTAAVGSPIVGASVQIVCAAGPALTNVTTSAIGSWSMDVIGQTFPCALQVSGGTINGASNPTAYQSIATAAGVANITPLTALVVANIAGVNPNSWFSTINAGALNAATETQINAAVANLRTALGLQALNSVNPMTQAFSPSAGVVLDDILASLAVALTNAGSNYAALLSTATSSGSGASFTPPAGLVNALITAYGSSVSGGGSGVFGGGTGGTDTMAITFVSTFGAPVEVGANLSITGINLGQAGDTLTFTFGGGASTSVQLIGTNQQATVVIPVSAQSGTFTVTNSRTGNSATSPSVLVLVTSASQCVSRDGVANTVPPTTPTAWADCSRQVPSSGNAKWVNSKFFIMGQNPASMSTDGYRWVSIGATFNDVAHNGTRYVGIITNNNTTLFKSASDSPANWTSQNFTLSGPGQFTLISAANGRFFIGTNNGSLVTSADGLNWTETATNLCTGSYQSVFYSGNQPVTYSGGKYRFNVRNGSVSGVFNSSCTSTDGLTWSQDAVYTPDTTAFDGSKYVEGRSDGIYTSADGISFFKSPVVAPIFTKLMWLGTQFVGIETTGFSETRVHTSTDGINWTLQALPSPAGLTMSGGQFVYAPELNRALLLGAFGVNGTFTSNPTGMYVWHNLPSATPAGTLPAPTGIVATGGNNHIDLSWQAVSGAIGYDVYESSTPGQPITSMTRIGTAQAATTAAVTGLTGGSTRYFKVVTVIDAVRRGGTSLEASATTSNALTWASASTTFSATHFTGVAWLGNKLVASVGLNQSVQNSANGATWVSTALSSNPLMTGRIGYAAAGTSMGPLAVALNNAGGIFTSNDGATWTAQTSGTTRYLKASASNGNIFVVVGDLGTILTSTDGITWTSRTSGVSTYISDVLWTGSKFVASTTNALLSSTDGITWTNAATTITADSMAWSGNQFVAIAGTAIYTSPDGITWTTRTSGVTANLTQVIWNGSTFAISGTAGTLLLSSNGSTWIANTLGTTQDMNGVAWTGSRFVVVGRNGTIKVSQ
jgi:hypothetical protein